MAMTRTEITRRWRHRHRKHARYLNSRSSTKNFVRNYANHQDLINLINRCENKLNQLRDENDDS